MLSGTPNAVCAVMRYCTKNYYKTESSGSSSSKIRTGIKSDLFLVKLLRNKEIKNKKPNLLSKIDDVRIKPRTF